MTTSLDDETTSGSLPLAQTPSLAAERVAGALALTGYLAAPVLEQDPYDLLWTCHFGLLLTAAALLLSRGPTWTAACFLWIWFGAFWWGLDALKGGRELGLVTLYVHLGGPALISWAAWRRRWPERWVGWRVTLGILALVLLCRFVTPAHENVNLSHGIREGWSEFQSYPLYLALLVSSGYAGISALEFGCRRLFPRAEAALAAPVEEALA